MSYFKRLVFKSSQKFYRIEVLGEITFDVYRHKHSQSSNYLKYKYKGCLKCENYLNGFYWRASCY